MEKIDVLLWTIGSGFALVFGLMLVLWNAMNQRFDNLEKSLVSKIDKLDEKLTDVDRRLCRLEGAFSSKDCCMIKDERTLRKAE